MKAVLRATFSLVSLWWLARSLWTLYAYEYRGLMPGPHVQVMALSLAFLAASDYARRIAGEYR